MSIEAHKNKGALGLQMSSSAKEQCWLGILLVKLYEWFLSNISHGTWVVHM